MFPLPRTILRSICAVSDATSAAATAKAERSFSSCVAGSDPQWNDGHYICGADPGDFQPANITFDLLEQLDEASKKKVRDKKLRHQMVCERAFAAFQAWFRELAQVLPTR